MFDADASRRAFSARLISLAERRRTAHPGPLNGEDLKVIARLEHLAHDGASLETGACLAMERLRADAGGRARLDALWSDLPETLGLVIWPASAAELAAWMVARCAQDGSMPARPRAPERDHWTMPPLWDRDGPSVAPASRVAQDFAGGVAVVAPMLALWELVAALQHWHDQGYAASHPGVPAKVVATVTEAQGRMIVPRAKDTIAFTPAPGRPLCRVTLSLPRGMAPDAPGHNLTVVPRSGGCEPPLVPGRIEDSATSLMVAASFLLAGLFALRVWTRLWRGRAAPVQRRDRAPAPSRRRAGFRAVTSRVHMRP